jgi:hypothetical protein
VSLVNEVTNPVEALDVGRLGAHFSECSEDGLRRKEQEVMLLEPGKYADFAIFEVDPTKVAANRISHISVSETLMEAVKRFV